jgi:hypothetical protein
MSPCHDVDTKQTGHVALVGSSALPFNLQLIACRGEMRETWKQIVSGEKLAKLRGIPKTRYYALEQGSKPSARELEALINLYEKYDPRLARKLSEAHDFSYGSQQCSGELFGEILSSLSSAKRKARISNLIDQTCDEAVHEYVYGDYRAAFEQINSVVWGLEDYLDHIESHKLVLAYARIASSGGQHHAALSALARWSQVNENAGSAISHAEIKLSRVSVLNRLEHRDGSVGAAGYEAVRQLVEAKSTPTLRKDNPTWNWLWHNSLRGAITTLTNHPGMVRRSSLRQMGRCLDSLNDNELNPYGIYVNSSLRIRTLAFLGELEDAWIMWRALRLVPEPIPGTEIHGRTTILLEYLSGHLEEALAEAEHWIRTCRSSNRPFQEAQFYRLRNLVLTKLNASSRKPIHGPGQLTQVPISWPVL